MTDTQWPRYYVFEQPEDGRPMIHAGSVHAADAEMALLTARDVFARRPKRKTMWVVRDKEIFAKTKEQLLGMEFSDESESDGGLQLFQVFIKRSHKGVCVLAGEVEATDAASALAIALRQYGALKPLLWWVIRDNAVLRTDDADNPVMYGSSPGKEYRHEKHYPVRTMMLELKNKNRPKR